MIMTQQVDKTFDIGEDINLGIVNNVKRIMENMITKLQKEVKTGITNNSEEIKAEIKAVITKVQDEIKADIYSMKLDMKNLIAMLGKESVDMSPIKSKLAKK